MATTRTSTCILLDGVILESNLTGGGSHSTCAVYSTTRSIGDNFICPIIGSRAVVAGSLYHFLRGIDSIINGSARGVVNGYRLIVKIRTVPGIGVVPITRIKAPVDAIAIRPRLEKRIIKRITKSPAPSITKAYLYVKAPVKSCRTPGIGPIKRIIKVGIVLESNVGIGVIIARIQILLIIRVKVGICAVGRVLGSYII